MKELEAIETIQQINLFREKKKQSPASLISRKYCHSAEHGNQFSPDWFRDPISETRLVCRQS